MVSPTTVGAIFREIVGRDGLEPSVVEETAARLKTILEQVRRLDELQLQPVPPAFAFDPGHPAYAAPPADPPLWSGLQGGGGTGYGGAGGVTGVQEAAPPETAAAAVRSRNELLDMDAVAMAEAVRHRKVSPVELVRAALAAIEELDPALNAFVTVTAEQALVEARAAEAAVMRGEPLGPLHGVPVAIKDVIETAGVRTTAGSAILAGYVPGRDASAVRRLRAAGAIVVGKTSTHEFAFGALTDSPHFGPTRNPRRLDRVPGGSSGGSGAAVAAGIVPLALGTDTGGSIRIPAAACGVVGLKPTYGRISKAGVLPLSWSLDHVGPLARSVRDAALAVEVLAGPDPDDPTALPVPPGDLSGAARAVRLDGLRVGVLEDWVADRVDPEVERAFREALRVLEDLGAALAPARVPPAPVMTLVNRLIALAEAGAYHAPLLAAHAGRYAPDVRLRMELGQVVSARDYLIGQRLRGELCRQLHAVMASFDLLAVPALPIPAPRIGQRVWTHAGGEREPVAEAMIRLTAPWNVTGQPALSICCGWTSEGLPVGLQLVGRPYEEPLLVRAAAAYEAASGRPAVPEAGRP